MEGILREVVKNERNTADYKTEVLEGTLEWFGKWRNDLEWDYDCAREPQMARRVYALDVEW